MTEITNDVFRSALRHKEVFVMREVSVVVVIGLIVCSLVILSAGHAADPRINLQALAAKRVPILLEFGRGWCKPCIYMKPILDDMAKVVNADLVRAFRIRMMPTQVFITPDGKEFLRNEGTLEREQIVQVFAKMGLAMPQAQPSQPLAVAQPPGAQLPQQSQKRPW
jgi:thioredoxin 1